MACLVAHSQRNHVSTRVTAPWFELAVVAVAVLSAATASVVGFGIGSFLTPLMAIRYGTAAAIAAVTIPHAVATALRCWRLRHHVDRRVLTRFGVVSALGGLAGALAFSRAGSRALTAVLGILLLLTAAAQLGGLAKAWRPHGALATLLGLGSGLFGGVAGNQGGLRAAALASFGLAPAAFVATSTATGLMVDAARAPIYLLRSGHLLHGMSLPIMLGTAGVIAGTLLGERVMLGLRREQFARVVAVAVGLLGIWLVARALID